MRTTLLLVISGNRVCGIFGASLSAGGRRGAASVWVYADLKNIGESTKDFEAAGYR